VARDALDLVAGIEALLQEKACAPEGGRYEATAKTNSEPKNERPPERQGGRYKGKRHGRLPGHNLTGTQTTRKAAGVMKQAAQN